MPPESETGPSNFFRNLLCYSPQIIAGWGRPPGKQKPSDAKSSPFLVLLSRVYSILPGGENIGSGGGQTVQDRPWNFYSPSIITQLLPFIYFMHNFPQHTTCYCAHQNIAVEVKTCAEQKESPTWGWGLVDHPTQPICIWIFIYVNIQGKGP